jgi:hypothetical protein
VVHAFVPEAPSGQGRLLWAACAPLVRISNFGRGWCRRSPASQPSSHEQCDAHAAQQQERHSTSSLGRGVAAFHVRREADGQWFVRAAEAFARAAESVRLLARIEAQNTHLAAELGHLRNVVADLRADCGDAQLIS